MPNGIPFLFDWIGVGTLRRGNLLLRIAVLFNLEQPGQVMLIGPAAFIAIPGLMVGRKDLAAKLTFFRFHDAPL